MLSNDLFFCLFLQLITAKLTQVSTNMPSSPDSSSDSSTGSPGNHGNHYSDGPNPEVESCLPGVVSLQQLFYIYIFFSFMTVEAAFMANVAMCEINSLYLHCTSESQNCLSAKEKFTMTHSCPGHSKLYWKFVLFCLICKFCCVLFISDFFLDAFHFTAKNVLFSYLVVI